MVQSPATKPVVDKAIGYRLQETAKVSAGAQHADRNDQFEYINALGAVRVRGGLPGRQRARSWAH